MKTICEMRGFLTFLVLRMLSKKSMSGQEIRDELCARKGCMPSAGTVYPVLKSLSDGKLIEEIPIDKKTKKYLLTKAGERELAIATKKFVALFCDMKDEFKR